MGEYLEIVNKIITTPIFEKENISNIFRNFRTEMIEKLMGTPISECLDYCSSFVTKQGRIFNSYSWVNFIIFLVDAGNQNCGNSIDS